MCYLQNHVTITGTDLEGPQEDRLFTLLFQTGPFQDLRIADRVGHQGLLTMVIESLVVCPLAGQRSVEAIISTS